MNVNRQLLLFFFATLLVSMLIFGCGSNQSNVTNQQNTVSSQRSALDKEDSLILSKVNAGDAAFIENAIKEGKRLDGTGYRSYVAQALSMYFITNDPVKNEGQLKIVDLLLNAGKFNKQEFIEIAEQSIGENPRWDKIKPVLEKMRQKGIDPNANKKFATGYSASALNFAAVYGDIKYLKWLVDNGGDVQAKDSLGNNLIMTQFTFDNRPSPATVLKRKQVIDFLISKGVSIKEKNNDGHTINDICDKTENVFVVTKSASEPREQENLKALRELRAYINAK